jgi:TPR repeat protein
MRTYGLILLTTIGCGAGTAGVAVQPKETTAAQALGQTECVDVAAGAEPLVVDWKPEQRRELERAMKDGVAVVAYSCKSIRLMNECKLDGTYGYIGMTPKEQVLQLESSDELHANLPLTGRQISAGLGRASSLEVAMIMVGKRRTTWVGPTSGDLKGECAGATHYVRGATVGAFALASGSRANVRASAQIFVAGTQGASSARKQIRNRAGDPAECEKASPDAESPPARCGAPVRLVLGPILPKTPGEADAEAHASGRAESSAACPVGLVEAGGKCTKLGAASVFQCRAGDADGCKQQCNKGHAGSCRELAELLARGVAPANAALPAHQACAGGEARGCTVLAQLRRSGTGVSKDEAAASELFEMACAGGDGAGCTALGQSVASADAARALSLFEKGCAGGDVAGCAAAGAQHLGSGAPGAKRDAIRARDALARACDGGDGPSCASLGALYDAGEPQLPKQPILAEMMLRRGCRRGSAQACAGLGMALASKQGGDPREAKQHLERACLGNEAVACAALKVAFDDARPFVLEIKQRMALNAACMGGSARACANVGLSDAASGNAIAAKPTLQRACAMGDAWACLVHSKLGK